MGKEKKENKEKKNNNIIERVFLSLFIISGLISLVSYIYKPYDNRKQAIEALNTYIHTNNLYSELEEFKCRKGTKCKTIDLDIDYEHKGIEEYERPTLEMNLEAGELLNNFFLKYHYDGEFTLTTSIGTFMRIDDNPEAVLFTDNNPDFRDSVSCDYGEPSGLDSLFAIKGVECYAHMNTFLKDPNKTVNFPDNYIEIVED